MPGANNPNTVIPGGFTTLVAGLYGNDTLHSWNSFQFYDDASLTRGTHSLKFGFAFGTDAIQFLHPIFTFWKIEIRIAERFSPQQPFLVRGRVAWAN